jgi:hypothetical protein
MREYEYYLKIKEMPPSPHRLPMEPEHGDFVWSDEEVGVYVFRHGDVQVYGTFWHHYATSGVAIGDIAPLRYATPTIERLADVRVEAYAPPTESSSWGFPVRPPQVRTKRRCRRG